MAAGGGVSEASVVAVMHIGETVFDAVAVGDGVTVAVGDGVTVAVDVRVDVLDGVGVGAAAVSVWAAAVCVPEMAVSTAA